MINIRKCIIEGILSLWGVGGMPTKLYRVNLTQEEREHLLGIM